MSEYVSPYSRSTRWLRGNLHAHTCCGRFMDLAESGRIYASLGYDFLAVTDHNKTHDPAQIELWAQQAGLVVIPGEENGKSDHLIELGVHEVSPTPSLGYHERAAALQVHGGFVIAAHPQEYDHGEANVRGASAALDAIELYNGLRESRGTDETRNVALWDELLSDGARLWGVATDDFHCQYITPGHGWVHVQVDEHAPVTWPLLLEQLRRGAFYASTYPTFERIELDGDVLHVCASKQTKAIRVVGPGGRTLAHVPGHALDWPVEPKLRYFRVEAVAGVKRAWSQPFFAA